MSNRSKLTIFLLIAQIIYPTQFYLILVIKDCARMHLMNERGIDFFSHKEKYQNAHSSCFQGEAFFGQDYRVAVECQQIHPFNAICQLQIKFKNRTEKAYGNAFMISNNIGVTSAHNLRTFCKNSNKIINAQLISATFYSVKNLKAQYEVTAYSISPNFNPLGQEKFFHDIAVILMKKIDSSSPHQHGLVQIQQAYQLKTEQFAMISSYTVQNAYSCTEKYIKTNTQLAKQQVKQSAARKNRLIIEGKKILHKISTDYGQSGSPILIKNNMNRYIVIGIHQGNIKLDGYNVGLYFGPELMNQLNICIQRVLGQASIVNTKNYKQLLKINKKLYRHYEGAINDQQIEKMFSDVSRDSNKTCIQNDTETLSRKSILANKEKESKIIQDKAYCVIFGYTVCKDKFF